DRAQSRHGIQPGRASDGTVPRGQGCTGNWPETRREAHLDGQAGDIASGCPHDRYSRWGGCYPVLPGQGRGARAVSSSRAAHAALDDAAEPGGNAACRAYYADRRLIAAATRRLDIRRATGGTGSPGGARGAAAAPDHTMSGARYHWWHARTQAAEFSGYAGIYRCFLERRVLKQLVLISFILKQAVKQMPCV